VAVHIVVVVVAVHIVVTILLLLWLSLFAPAQNSLYSLFASFTQAVEYSFHLIQIYTLLNKLLRISFSREILIIILSRVK